MSEGEKNVYFTMAKKIDAEHKNKYPGKWISWNMQLSVAAVLLLHKTAK
jgi:hypothetical protein